MQILLSLKVGIMAISKIAHVCVQRPPNDAKARLASPLCAPLDKEFHYQRELCECSGAVTISEILIIRSLQVGR